MQTLRLTLDKILIELFESIDPVKLVKKTIQVKNNEFTAAGKSYNLTSYDRVVVIGAGKASARMALAVESILGDCISTGLVAVTEDDKTVLKRINLVYGKHPFPNQNSLINGRRIFDMAKSLAENDLAVVLISGGGSALMELLPEKLSLNLYVTLIQKLMLNGASIDEINLIRQNLSLIKGGKLAEALYPADVITLILSDVIGDKIEFVASGPTVKPVFHSDILPVNILDKYGVKKNQFLLIYDLLNKASTHKLDESKFDKTNNILIGNNYLALESIKNYLSTIGIDATIISSSIKGEARVAGKKLIKKIIELTKTLTKPHCFIWGGETIVTVKGNGKGGRCQEMVISMLIELQNFEREFVLTCFGTDGKDGNSDVAGAVVDIQTWELVKKENLIPEDYLNENNSNKFFERINCELKFGNTGTNLMDIGIMLIN
ncbi:MAG: DUF4147 domain-containing protein [Melioribacteraceae bacterium]|nr:DUF4147 domain-containing protein [Melioribacteraceae bacterium]